MRKIIWVLFFTLATVFYARAQGNTNGYKVISEKMFMNQVTERLSELKISELDVLISQQSLYGTGGISDIHLSAGISYNKTKAYAGYDYMDNVSVYSEASKTITNTGTNLAAGVEYSLTKTDYGLSTSDIYSPKIYVNVSQPLLKNAMGRLDRFAGANAALALELQKVKRSESDTVLINGYRKLYYKWASWEKNLGLLRTSIENAEKILKEIERRYANNLADLDEVEQARSSLISYREKHESVNNSLNVLKASLSPYIDLSDRIPDATQFEKLYKKASVYKYIEVDFRKSRNSEILELTLDQAGLGLDYYQDKLRPELTLSAGLALKTQENEIGESFGVGDADYNIALTLNMPLGNSAAKADAKISELQVVSLLNEIEVARNVYESGLRSLIEDITSSKRMFELREANIRALQSQYDIQINKYRQARVEINNIIQADNRIADELVNIVNLQYGLIDNYLEYGYLTGRE